jgi:hypothetical protein
VKRRNERVKRRNERVKRRNERVKRLKLIGINFKGGVWLTCAGNDGHAGEAGIVYAVFVGNGWFCF